MYSRQWPEGWRGQFCHWKIWKQHSLTDELYLMIIRMMMPSLKPSSLAARAEERCEGFIVIVLVTCPVFDCSLRWPWEAIEMFPWEEENWEPAGPKISTLLGKARIQSFSTAGCGWQLRNFDILNKRRPTNKEVYYSTSSHPVSDSSVSDLPTLDFTLPACNTWEENTWSGCSLKFVFSKRDRLFPQKNVLPLQEKQIELWVCLCPRQLLPWRCSAERQRGCRWLKRRGSWRGFHIEWFTLDMNLPELCVWFHGQSWLAWS